MNTPTQNSSGLVRDVLDAFDKLNGPQPGYRPAHAKGILLSGVFHPSAEARTITRAPHMNQESTPVTVRFSNTTGIPDIPDGSADASPRGIAIRFLLAAHVHTDVIAHSVDGFPVRTAEEFVELLRAIGASKPDTPKPTPIERFLGTHPAALAFVQSPKPTPKSFANETYYAVNAHRFTNAAGQSRFGRYTIEPVDGSSYYSAEEVAKLAPNALFDELRARIGSRPIEMRVTLQLAAESDVTDDATVRWPDDRPRATLGVVELTAEAPSQEAEQRHIIFDPVPRVDGIDPSSDPLIETRADVYLASGRRRRAQVSSAATA